MSNINLDKKILEMVRLVPDPQKQLEAVRDVLSRIEKSPPKKNSRPQRNLLRKIIKDLLKVENCKQEAAAMMSRLRELSKNPRKRKLKIISPIVEEVILPVICPAELPAASTTVQMVEEVATPVATAEPGPIAPPTSTEAIAKTEICGRISWTCMNCRSESLCRDVGNNQWWCRSCESEKNMLEPPSSVPVLHYHITAPPEARSSFARQNEAAQCVARTAEENKEVRRRQQEAEERKQKLATVSKLPMSEQIKLLMP